MALMAAGMGLAGSASATLLDRGTAMVYDDVLNITWTRQAGDGAVRNWADSVAWANNLVFADFDDWRLPWASAIAQAGPTPSVVECQTATELACRDNEMGYMFFHNLGGAKFDSKTGTQTAAGGQVLTGIRGSAVPLRSYWSGTEFEINNDVSAWAFNFSDSFQDFLVKESFYYAWAVHPGDVAAIPEPESYALLLAGLGLMGFVARRRRTTSTATAPR